MLAEKRNCGTAAKVEVFKLAFVSLQLWGMFKSGMHIYIYIYIFVSISHVASVLWYYYHYVDTQLGPN